MLAGCAQLLLRKNKAGSSPIVTLAYSHKGVLYSTLRGQECHLIVYELIEVVAWHSNSCSRVFVSAYATVLDMQDCTDQPKHGIYFNNEGSIACYSTRLSYDCICFRWASRQDV